MWEMSGHNLHTSHWRGRGELSGIHLFQIIVLVILYRSQACVLLQKRPAQDVCPSWIEAYVNDDSFCENKKILRVTPVQGFGNQLNGVLQGMFGAYLLDRCLIIDWKFAGFLNISTPILQRRYATIRMNNVSKQSWKRKYHYIFPPRKRKLEDLTYSESFENELATMQVGYRDRLCRYLYSPKFSEVSLGISEHYTSKKRKSRTLCIFFENCMLRQILRPSATLINALNDYQRIVRKDNRGFIAIQIRMGDYNSYKEVGQITHSTDERIPARALKSFWKAAKACTKKFTSVNGKRSIGYFIATDNELALEAARAALGSQNILFISGSLHHSDSKSADEHSLMKMLLDWFLLSEADIVIQGPWSTFVEKSIVFSKKEQRIIRCSSVKDNVSQLNLIAVEDDWACFQNMLKDTKKGPRAVEITV